MNKVSIIGAGNVATHLGMALKAIGCEIVQVWSRTADSANILAQQLNAEAITTLTSLNDKAEIYILSVVDDAMPDIIKQFPFSDKLLCHTAGSVSMDILKEASAAYGVFYPLQTFSKAKQVDFSKIPLFIEGNNSHVQ